MASINQIVSKFTRTSNEYQLLKKDGVRIMFLNNDLHHNISNVLVPLLQNLKTLKILIIENQSEFENIFNIIFASNFENQLRNIIEILKNVLKQSQKNLN